jgi:hypothetical protein
MANVKRISHMVEAAKVGTKLEEVGRKGTIPLGKGAHFTQYCVNYQTPFDLIKGLSKDVLIKEMRWMYRHHSKYLSLKISDKMRDLGVRSIQRNTGTDYGDGVFKGVSAKEMLRTLHSVSETYGIPERKFQVRRVLFTNLKGEEVAGFKRMKKPEAVNGDLNHTRANLVLGMTSYWVPKGKKNSRQLLETLSAKKSKCRMVEEHKKYLICS